MHSLKEMTIKEKILWLWLTAILLVYFFTQSYDDFTTVINMSYGFIDGILTGHIAQGINSIEWLYGILIYLVVAIWSIPVWIILHIFKLDSSYVISIGSLIWYKLLLVIVAVACIYVFLQIANIFWNKKNNTILTFTYLSSILFVLPVLEITQWDGFELFFMLYGIYYFLKEDGKKFLIFFMIANALKPFTAFVFIPLLFYKYKNVLKIIGMSLAGFAVLVADKLIVKLISTESTVGRSKMVDFVENLLCSKIEIGHEASAFLFFFILVCVFAYLLKYDGSLKSKRTALWLVTLSLDVFILIGGVIMSYWALLLVPFNSLLVYFDEENTNAAMLLEMIGSYAYVFKESISLTWVFGGWDIFEHMILKNVGNHTITGQNAFRYYIDIVKGSPEILDDNIHVIQAVCLGCMAGLMIISCPFRKKQVASGNLQKADNWILACRILAITVFWLVCLYVLVIL